MSWALGGLVAGDPLDKRARERLTCIDSKLVLSRRSMRRLKVAGGSQLGEQRCLCLLVSLLPSGRLVALRPSCTLQTTTSTVCSTPYLETMVPQESNRCIDLSARLHGHKARSRKTWISCLQLQVLNP